MDYLTITWGLEKGLELGPITLRWYSLLFAMGFIFGFRIMLRYFKQEGISEKMLDKMLVYSVVGTVVGARLGHVFFYDWDKYKDNLIEIPMVWKGGLASHGAAIALIIAMWLFGRKLVNYFDNASEYQRSLWALDRLVITVALAGCFIRLGNFANSEIYGNISNSSIETVFVTNVNDALETVYHEFFESVEMNPTDEVFKTDSITYPVYVLSVTPAVGQGHTDQEIAGVLSSSVPRYLENLEQNRKNALPMPGEEISYNQASGKLEVKVLGVPRLPTQIIESLGYLLIYFILRFLFTKENLRYRNGFMFGAFLVLIFGFRFVIEYWKDYQSSFEATMALNRGQQLSIPLVLIGLFFLSRNVQVKPKKVAE
ncbi:MAG: prolipoprotein diacylglyceryl transferase [Flavobacteriia bacterium]|nr:prolipoprotein diacylglyceryl transferase [Flavobacteriia bacterium]